MKQRSKHLMITGGTGYIGSRLVEMAISQGHHVTLLGNVRDDVKCRTLSWRLGDDLPETAFLSSDEGKVDVVLHLAHDWNSDGREADVNLEGTRVLLQAARRSGVSRFIFCSSVSARPDALNRYGRIKAQVEELLTGDSEIGARVGLVYGGKQEAMWGAICKMVNISPVLPMFGIEKPVQPIHVDEVCEGLLRLASTETLDRPAYGLAAPVAVTFGDFMRQVSLSNCFRKLHLIPLPISFVLFAVSVFNRLPFLPKLNTERILGIASLRYLPCSDDLAVLEMDIMSLSDGLQSN